MAEPNLPHLPPEIVEEIINNLPVKSLFRFRCVSKSWHSFISETMLVHKHLMSRNNLSRKTLILENPMESVGKQLCGCSLSSFQSRQIKVGEGRIFTGSDVGFVWKLVGSCDGLLCAHDGLSIYIWNPCDSKRVRVLPINTPGRPASCDFSTCYFGFGYDSTSDDYKLCFLSNPQRGSTTNTFVYSLKRNSWEQLNNFPPNYLPRKSVFVNELIYWLGFSGNLGRSPFALFSLDLSDNKYSEVSLPECLPHNHLVDIKLCLLKEMLCVLVRSNSSSLVLWKMGKDCHNPERKSWIQFLDLRFELVFDKDCGLVDIEPFYMYENGDVLMGAVSKKGTEVLLCRDSVVLFRKILFKQQALIRYGLVYVESMLFPNSVDDVSVTSCKYITSKDGDRGHNCGIMCYLRRFSDFVFGSFGGKFTSSR